jgi:GrpB-like predicted nucleotidyltransferase (UPF0157 family)
MTSPERYGGGTIIIRDYDPAWPAMFAEERRRIFEALGPKVLTIEHFGSTAVPGLAAKPIIDLLVGVNNLGEARGFCLEPLQALGYTYIPDHESSFLPNELFFRKGLPWTHHVHVMEPSTDRWTYFLTLRDYLRGEPEIASAYGSLKKAIAFVFGDDIAGYRNTKAPFVQALNARARAKTLRPPS